MGALPAAFVHAVEIANAGVFSNAGAFADGPVASVVGSGGDPLTAQGYLVGIVALIVLGAGYLISLPLHPFSKCRRCKGTGRHQGAVFSYAFRVCTKCSGTGRQLRWGSRISGRVP